MHCSSQFARENENSERNLLPISVVLVLHIGDLDSTVLLCVLSVELVPLLVLEVRDHVENLAGGGGEGTEENALLGVA